MTASSFVLLGGMLAGSVAVAGAPLGTLDTIYLPGIGSSTGTEILHGTPRDAFGQSVAFIGDVNNDGIDDIAVSAPATNDPSAIDQVYVVFGTPTGLPIRSISARSMAATVSR